MVNVFTIFKAWSGINSFKDLFLSFFTSSGLTSRTDGRTLSGENLNQILLVNMIYPTGVGSFSAESLPQHFRKLNLISASYIMVRARIKSSQNRAQVRRKIVPASKLQNSVQNWQLLWAFYPQPVNQVWKKMARSELYNCVRGFSREPGLAQE